MATTDHRTSTATAVAVPWYDLIPDPEPPEDALQQATTITNVMSILLARYADDPTVLCSSQANVIYDSRVPGSYLAPDLFIVFGLETDSRAIEWGRRSYRIDEWGPTPAFVLEVASASTASRDLNEKRDIYARMGVQEYWRLDRYVEYYGEPVAGETLVDGQYHRFEVHTDANGDVWSRSQVLGVDFVYRAEDEYPRFLLRDSSTGEWLHTLEEEQAAHAQTEAARLAAEARADRLQAELDRLRHQRGDTS